MEPSLSARRAGMADTARRTLGICLLLVVVTLWTASNFLASVSAEQLHYSYDGLL